MHFAPKPDPVFTAYVDALTARENGDRAAWVEAHCRAGELAREEFEKAELAKATKATERRVA